MSIFFKKGLFLQQILTHKYPAKDRQALLNKFIFLNKQPAEL